ncbi:MAG: hypothetical protein Q8N63_08485 [Nanoarchaeota archaeon]|nr:hypothetical protein [Nanoarchaeota archaeon]
MVNENSKDSILEYLQKNGATNTFKLAHVLDIKRDILLGILKNLEKQELVRIITGKVEFLSYPLSKEKKKPKVSKEKSEIQTLQEEAEKQKLYAEKLKAQIKKLEQRPQKVITRTIIKEAEPIKSKQEKRRKRKKIKEAKIKSKKIVEKGVKLRKESKKGFGIKKSFRKIGLKIKGGAGMGIFKIKNFIKDLKRR